MRVFINVCIMLTVSYAALFAQSSNLPLIILTTGGTEIPGEPKVEIHMGIIHTEGSINHIDDPYNIYDGNIGIERRGSSSSSWPKKSYSIETRNSDGSNLNVALLGMPEENDWILYGPYADKSLIRNVLALELGNKMGRWSPRTRFCELYIDGAYRGVYVLMEKIKRDGDRLNIAALNPDEISGDDLTGGYLLKIDRPDDYWTSSYTSPVGGYPVPISYVYPAFDDMPQVQRDYIKNYVDDFEDALAGDEFMDPYLGYRNYINTETFVDYFLINELTRNVDAYRLSAFFYKLKDSDGGKLSMGPLWDFNFSLGNADYYEAYKADGWMIHTVPAYDGYQAPFWWDRLREDPYFNAALRIRWESLRQTIFSLENIEYKIDSLATLLDDAQARNFVEYPILGTYIWPNYYVGDTYEGEINFLKSWISERMDWMDQQLGTIDDLNTQSLSVNPYELMVYPNPFIEEINVKFYALKSCELTISLFDRMGKQIHSKDIEALQGFSEINLPLGSFTQGSGIYLLQFHADGRLIRTEKIRKN